MSDILTDGEIEARAKSREFAWERLEDARRLAIIAQDFLALGDDRGAGYALARLTINIQHAVSTVAELSPRRAPA